MHLNVAQISPDTDAEGPGRRFAVWVQGCAIQCPGCCNPEMFGFDGGERVDVAELAQRVLDQPHIDGLTLLGGEPFHQALPAAELCRLVRAGGRDVVVFTGFVIEDLRARKSAHVAAMLDQIDLLVDGRYHADEPEPERRWIGSRNQRYHFLTDRWNLADPQFWTGNTIEIRWDGKELLVNGWPAESDELLALVKGR